ncbi:hypothetical protein BB559_002822 [Furculomyces boomerangus]|uniref:Uncharacterized protein n=1 Tax=Furculomyces boomerangus TaxID=61424 RepID=A0A2T9YS48_9FUNG|nr:hypothetical protein BB559_002822 [Furculomyces boomerangus]
MEVALSESLETGGVCNLVERNSINKDLNMKPLVMKNQWGINPDKISKFGFTGNPRINVKIEDPTNPLEFFEQLLTDKIIENIVIQTICRYKQISVNTK